MSHAEHSFHSDGKLKANVFVAFCLVVLCPVALWFFYFRYDHIPGTQEKQNAEQLIYGYCRAYSQPDFHSKDIFTDTLSYMGIPMTTVDIDHEVAVLRQTEMYPRITLIPETVHDTLHGDTLNATAWLKEVVYMKAQMQYRQREMEFTFSFNKKGRIIAIDTSGTRNLKYGREMPK